MVKGYITYSYCLNHVAYAMIEGFFPSEIKVRKGKLKK